jgi:ATP-dependent Clp protease ATP-binding subunit ClpA
MLERFVRDSRRAVARAQEEALGLGADTVDGEHLLLALSASGGAAERALADMGLDRGGVLEALELEWARSLAVAGIRDAPPRFGPAAAGGGQMPFSPAAKRALERALRSTLDRGDRRIETGHLLLGLLWAEAGTVPRALEAAGVDRVDLRAAVERELDQPPTCSE